MIPWPSVKGPPLKFPAEPEITISPFPPRIWLTGEGRLDAQTLGGKAPAVVARWAQAAGVPVIALAGEVAPELTRSALPSEWPFTACFSIVSAPMTPKDAMSEAAQLLEAKAFGLGRIVGSLFAGRR